MKKLYITTLALFSILALSLTITACGVTEITKTVTNTQGPTVIVVPSQPPDIPHPLLIEIGGHPVLEGEELLCWYCHGIPENPSHTGFWLDEDFCTQCHKMSDDPLVVPYQR